jgi:hypothetical protein
MQCSTPELTSRSGANYRMKSGTIGKYRENSANIHF